jgi:hypothetical protein
VRARHFFMGARHRATVLIFLAMSFAFFSVFNCFLGLLIKKIVKAKYLDLLIFFYIFRNWFTFEDPLKIGHFRDTSYREVFN